MTTLRLTLFVVPLSSHVRPSARDDGPRRVLAADYSTSIAIVDPATGKLEWDHRIDNIHDLHRLPDGNILFQTSMTRLLGGAEGEQGGVGVRLQKSKRQRGQRVEVTRFALPTGRRCRRVGGDALSRWTRERRKADQAQGRETTRTGTRDSCGSSTTATTSSPTRAKRGARIRRRRQCSWDYPVPLFGKERRGGTGRRRSATRSVPRCGSPTGTPSSAPATATACWR